MPQSLAGHAKAGHTIPEPECHRSIYNLWWQTLEYFDPFLVGLTATPTAQTIGFFNGNLVQEYTNEKAVADNVNVGYQVYELITQISQQGAKLAKEPGIFVPHRDRRTKARLGVSLLGNRSYFGTRKNTEGLTLKCCASLTM